MPGSLLDKVFHPLTIIKRTIQKIRGILEKERPVLVNLTPHDVVIRQNEEDIIIPRSGVIARVKETEIHTETIDGVQITDIRYDKTLNLPPPEENTYYIVSVVVAYANKDRNDLVFPDGLNAYRDEKGQIVAVPGLRRIVYALGTTEKISDFFKLSTI
ncbi:MAG: hypothetical protein PVF58_02565 [Candidatus Methanofastidiosia archaeon]|jgi:hypothetical protein